MCIVLQERLQSQHFVNIEELEDEIYWKFLGNEGAQIKWCQIEMYIQLRGKFKGLLKVNLRIKFDKTTQLNIDNTYVRDNCDPSDDLEDPSNLQWSDYLLCEHV
jgi:hypothetical protein